MTWKKARNSFIDFMFRRGIWIRKSTPPHIITPMMARVSMSTIPITEGRQYFFGQLTFAGQTIYGPEALRGQMLDLVEQPYTDVRLADIPRRLQAYYRARGYYDVKVDAIGDPAAARDGKVPVHVTIAPGDSITSTA